MLGRERLPGEPGVEHELRDGRLGVLDARALDAVGQDPHVHREVGRGVELVPGVPLPAPAVRAREADVMEHGQAFEAVADRGCLELDEHLVRRHLGECAGEVLGDLTKVVVGDRREVLDRSPGVREPPALGLCLGQRLEVLELLAGRGEAAVDRVARRADERLAELGVGQRGEGREVERLVDHDRLDVEGGGALERVREQRAASAAAVGGVRASQRVEPALDAHEVGHEPTETARGHGREQGFEKLDLARGGQRREVARGLLAHRLGVVRRELRDDPDERVTRRGLGAQELEQLDLAGRAQQRSDGHDLVVVGDQVVLDAGLRREHREGVAVVVGRDGTVEDRRHDGGRDVRLGDPAVAQDRDQQLGGPGTADAGLADLARRAPVAARLGDVRQQGREPGRKPVRGTRDVGRDGREEPSETDERLDLDRLGERVEVAAGRRALVHVPAGHALLDGLVLGLARVGPHAQRRGPVEQAVRRVVAALRELGHELRSLARCGRRRQPAPRDPGCPRPGSSARRPAGRTVRRAAPSRTRAAPLRLRPHRRRLPGANP